MSKKIKTVYDQNPTDADDENETYYFPLGNNQGKAISGSKSQVSDIVATEGRVRDMDLEISALQTGNPVPDPDQTAATWTATLPDNRLTANVQVNNFNGTAYAFVINDETVPTYPDDFTVGSPPSTLLLDSIGTKSIILYQYDAAVEAIPPAFPNEDGDLAIVLTPRFDPEVITDFTLTLGSPATSAFSATWTDPNVTAGTHAINQYDIYDFDDNPIRANVTSPVSFTGMDADTTYNYKVRATYQSGQVVDSEPFSLTTDESGVGVVSITQPSTARVNGAGGYEIDEDDVGTLDINVTLDTAVTSGSVDVQYRFVDITAEEGTHYDDDYVGTEGTLSFTSVTGQTLTVSLDPTDQTSSVNRQVQLELIDNASKTSGLTIDKTRYDYGYGNAVLLYINGTSGGTEGFVQDDTDGNGLIVIDMGNVNGTDIPAEDTGDNPIAGSEFIETNATSGANNDVYLSTGYSLRYDEYVTTTAADYVGRAPRRDFLCNFTKTTTTYYFHLRMRSTTSTANDQVSVDVDDNFESTLREFQVFNPSTDDRTLHGWAWVHTDSWTASGQTGTARTLSIAPGQKTVSLLQYDPDMRVDKMVITSNASYDPATVGDPGETPTRDDNYGPPESTYNTGGGGETTDDDGNIVFPIRPVDPSLSVVAPTTLSPADNATDVDYRTTVIFAEYSFLANIADYTFRVYSWTSPTASTAAEISGNVTLSGAANNRLEFRPTVQLSQDQDYFAVITGTALDTSGVLRSIALNSVDTPTSWDFSTPAPASVGLVEQIDFNSYTENRQYTVDDARSDFRPLESVAKFTTKVAGSSPGYDEGACYITDSPDGNTARGKVLQIEFDGTKDQNDHHLEVFHHFGADHVNLYPNRNATEGLNYPMSSYVNGYFGVPPQTAAESREQNHTTHVSGGGDPYRFDELYHAYDIYLDPDWEYIPYHKLGGFNSGDNIQASHAAKAEANREGYYGFTVHHAISGREWSLEKMGALQAYYYTTDRVAINQWCNVVDPTTEPTQESEYFKVPRGKWVTIQQRLKLNTTNTTYNIAYPGPGDDYVSISTRGYWPEVADEIGYPRNIGKDAPDAGDLKDGIYEIWVQIEGQAPIKVFSRSAIRIRCWEYLRITMHRVRFYNNYNPNTTQYIPNKIQSYYVDNFRWSTSPIIT